MKPIINFEFPEKSVPALEILSTFFIFTTSTTITTVENFIRVETASSIIYVMLEKWQETYALYIITLSPL